ncbi:response regulator transcription factor [uncultured Pseudokineococcus sp.]|uniref:response regulator n=1 Tax=uncultured Pseudokineococcus sp. TaxID=1642928 RepID=UPI00262B38A0|nr:response regulator transcription factor [uncultured Pseudokineococcus sp.]
MAAEGGPPAPVRVVVVDDHAALRGGVRAALEADGFTVVAEGATARRAVELAVEHEPDVLLLDVHMPGSGVAAAQEVSRRLPGTAVVMLTASQDEEDLLGSLRAGARGFLLKDMDPARLGAALRGVLAGEAALPRALVARVLEELRAAPAPRRTLLPRRRAAARLTEREEAVMVLLRDGLTTDEVAARLFLTPGTVRVHVSNAVRKLGAPDRASALGMLGGG